MFVFVLAVKGQKKATTENNSAQFPDGQLRGM